MSKCVEAFKAEFGYEFHHAPAIVRQAWQAAWNARGKVDAEICREAGKEFTKPDYKATYLLCASVIEKENEQ